jgi:hypothetical protein
VQSTQLCKPLCVSRGGGHEVAWCSSVQYSAVWLARCCARVYYFTGWMQGVDAAQPHI